MAAINELKSVVNTNTNSNPNCSHTNTTQTLQSMDNRKQLLCRFHIRGSCRDGDWCQFSHDMAGSVPIPETVCWFYLQSHCMYGDNCRFVHSDASTILANHQQSGPGVGDESTPVSTSGATTCAPILQLMSTELSRQQSLQSIANDPIETVVIEPKTKTQLNSNYSTVRPQLVPFNQSVISSSQQQSNQSSNPSLITDSRQSSEDSGYSEPTNSSSNQTMSTSRGSGSSAPIRSQNCGKTYAQIMGSKHVSTTGQSKTDSNMNTSVPYGGGVVVPAHTYVTTSTTSAPKLKTLCPYSMNTIDGSCPYPDGQCQYTHGAICDLCGRCCLDPNDIDQQNKHRDECIREHEREMEISFAVQRSLDKACGICMDIVIEKEPITERRFGILEKCSHIFCLSCIRKWRQTKQFENRTIRACPECRVSSDFVIPSKYWYEERNEKQSLIDSYKSALSAKPCKYFKQGQGECPFAGACFYLHAYPDGRKADIPPPRQRRRRQNHEGELEILRDMHLWNYLEVRDDNSWLLTLDLEDVFDIQEMGLLSGYETDDESDLSDYAEGLIG